MFVSNLSTTGLHNDLICIGQNSLTLLQNNFSQEESKYVNIRSLGSLLMHVIQVLKYLINSIGQFVISYKLLNSFNFV